MFNKIKATLTIIILHGPILSTIVLIVIVDLLKNEDFDLKFANLILNILLIPLILLILISWPLFHLFYFKIKISIIEKAILRIKRRILKGYKKADDKNIEQNKIQKFLSKNIHIISSVIIGGVYCFTEIFLLININNELSKFINSEGKLIKIIIYAVQFFIIPLFLIMGLSFSISHKNSNKYLLIPIVLGSKNLI